MAKKCKNATKIKKLRSNKVKNNLFFELLKKWFSPLCKGTCSFYSNKIFVLYYKLRILRKQEKVVNDKVTLIFFNKLRIMFYHFIYKNFDKSSYYPIKKQAFQLAFCSKCLTPVTVVLHPHTLCCVYRLFDRVALPAPSLLFLHKDCLIET